MPVISKFTVGGHPVTKYNNQRLRQFVINGETCPFAKVAESLNGTLPDPISYRIHRLQASGNSSQATGSVPKYNCQGSSSVLNVGSFIKGDIYSVPITADGITATFSQTNGTYAITGTSSAQGNVLLHNKITLENGHKYLVPTFRDATAAGASNYFRWGNVYARGIPAANFYWPDQSKAQSWAIVTGNGSSGYCVFNFMNGLDTSVSGFDPSGCFNLIDLTQLYGAGNEPANPETVFQDYPEIPVGNDSWVKNNIIRSISSITLGGHTVSVDLRSAGSVYDEWASNSHGTRKCGEVDLATLAFTYDSAYTQHHRWYVSVSGTMKLPANNDSIANLTCSTYTARSINDMHYNGGTGIGIAQTNGNLYVYNDSNTTPPSGTLVYELDTSTAFTAGSPLTLASGLTPTDQDGNAVTFTEGTEATPSPNYPVPIVNSSYISITDGQDTNSASIDLAGLTDKDEVYVNVMSTNLQDIDDITASNNCSVYASQIRPFSNYFTISKSGDSVSITCSNKNAAGCLYLCPVEAGKTYVISYITTGSYGILTNNPLIYKEHKGAESEPFTAAGGYIQTASDGARYCVFTAPVNAELFLTFYQSSRVATWSNIFSQISVTEGSSYTPYMPHNTIGKVWYKANTALLDMSTISVFDLSNAPNCSFSGISSVVKRPPSNNDEVVVKCSVYKSTSRANVLNDNNQICINIGGTAVFRDTNITSGMSVAQMQAYYAGCYFLYPLASPVWSDITSSAMGAALLALETIEETSNTMTINNSGVIDMVQYFTPI